MDINLNSQKVSPEKTEKESAKTAETMAKNSPSPLFTTQNETAGTIACNTSSANNNSGGGSINALG